MKNQNNINTPKATVSLGEGVDLKIITSNQGTDQSGEDIQQHSYEEQDDISAGNSIEKESLTSEEILSRINIINKKYSDKSLLLKMSDKFMAKNEPNLKTKKFFSETVEFQYEDLDILMQDCYMNNQGITIGESHNERGPKKFVKNLIPILSQLGIKYLFMEEFHIYQQNGLNIFFETGFVEDYLNEHLDGKNRKNAFSGPDSYRGILEKSRKYGIRVIGIDSSTASYSRDNVENRWKAGNYLAYEVIKNIAEDNKYAVFCGAGHLTLRHDNIPGIANLTDTLSINVKESEDDFRVTSNQMDKVSNNEYIYCDLSVELGKGPCLH